MSLSNSVSELDDNAPHLPSIYDTYLCTEPASGVPLLIRNGPDDYTASMRTLQRSADFFAERDQIRAVERLQWEMAKVHMQNEQWERAARILTPLWQTLSWRKAGWWQLLEKLDWALHECASRIQDLETLIAVDWELFSNSLTPRQNFVYDFSSTLQPFERLNSRPRSVVKAEVSVTFAFSASEGNVGVKLQSEVIISSRAQTSSKPLVLSQIKVAFGGSMKNLAVNHESRQTPRVISADKSLSIYQVAMQKSLPDPSVGLSSPTHSRAGHSADDLIGAADLMLAPGDTKALMFDHFPRDAEDVEVASLTMCIKESEFDLTVILTDDEQMHQSVFWLPSESDPVKKTLKTMRSSAVKILPKPPKMQIEIHNVAPICYTNELITVNLWLMNEEVEETDVVLEARVVGSMGTLPCMIWKSDQETKDSEGKPLIDRPLNQKKNTSISKAIGRIASSAHQSHEICVEGLSEAAEYTVEVRARYYLISDSETLVSKFNSAKIAVRLPFEVSYSFTPMIDHEPWPSYFDANILDKDNMSDEGGQKRQTTGLKQTWKFTSRLYSLASESLIVEAVNSRILEVHEAAVCSVTPTNKETMKVIKIFPDELKEHEFILEARKTDLEDRQSTSLGLRMEVAWRRVGFQGPPTVTHLAVPELVIPFGEPRVLAMAQNGEIPQGVVHLLYFIENPSTYALTFKVTMEPSEDFAFSGPKIVSLELLPLSRHTIRYNLMPLVKGAWINPQLRVFDTHFHKALKVSGTEGMRSDKTGLSIWVDADGEV